MPITNSYEVSMIHIRGKIPYCKFQIGRHVGIINTTNRDRVEMNKTERQDRTPKDLYKSKDGHRITTVKTNHY